MVSEVKGNRERLEKVSPVLFLQGQSWFDNAIITCSALFSVCRHVWVFKFTHTYVLDILAL